MGDRLVLHFLVLNRRPAVWISDYPSYPTLKIIFVLCIQILEIQQYLHLKLIIKIRLYTLTLAPKTQYISHNILLFISQAIYWLANFISNLHRGFYVGDSSNLITIFQWKFEMGYQREFSGFMPIFAFDYLISGFQHEPIQVWTKDFTRLSKRRKNRKTQKWIRTNHCCRML